MSYEYVIFNTIFYQPIAIVGCRPYSENSFIEMPFVSFHYKLMCATYYVNVVCRVELKNIQILNRV